MLVRPELMFKKMASGKKYKISCLLDYLKYREGGGGGDSFAA